MNIYIHTYIYIYIYTYTTPSVVRAPDWKSDFDTAFLSIRNYPSVQGAAVGNTVRFYGTLE